MNLALWIEQAHTQMIDVGIDYTDAKCDLVFLIEDFIGISRVAQQWAYEYEISMEQQSKLNEAILLRVARKPLSQILGSWEFWGLPFKVNHEVLTPRPDTEVLVEEALSWLSQYHLSLAMNQEEKHKLIMIDVGCGSGCIGLSLAHEVADSQITLIDISTAALQVAYVNRDTLQNANMLQGEVSIIQSDLLTTYIESLKDKHLSRTVDLLVSNPPYIRPDDMDNLMPEVKLYEPHLALQGATKDGLGHVRCLVQQATHVLKIGAALMLEVGWDQTQQALEILKRSGFKQCWIRKDYAGHPRVVAGLYNPT
jgi:release factor glutamine methyltransferase